MYRVLHCIPFYSIVSHMISLETRAFKVNFIQFGATITHFIIKQLDIDIVAGFDTELDYRTKNTPYFGSVIGRVCNRYIN